MALVDYLSCACICMDLETDKREEALQVLLDQLVSAKKLPQKLTERALEALLEREKLGSTAIGRGGAVPHARLDELKRIVMAFGYSRSGVVFNALDGQPVHQIFLVLASRDCGNEYMGVLERITCLVQNEDFRRFMSRAGGCQEALELIKEMDA